MATDKAYNNGMGATPIYKGPEDITRRLKLASETELLTLSKAHAPEIATAANNEIITRQGGTPPEPKKDAEGAVTEPTLNENTTLTDPEPMPSIFGDAEAVDLANFKMVEPDTFTYKAPAKATPAASFVVEGITGQPSEDNAMDEQKAMEMDQLKQESRKAEMIAGILSSLDTPAAKITKAREVINTPPTPKTTGNLYVEAKFPSLIGDAVAQSTADGLDHSMVVEKSQAAIAAAAGAPDFETFMKTEGDYSVYMSVNLLNEMLNTDYGKKVMERFRTIEAYSKEMVESKRERTAKLRNEYGTVLGSAIDMLTPDDIVANTVSLAKHVTNIAAVPFTTLPIKSPKDYAEFISMIPNANAPEMDTIAVEFLSHLFDPAKDGYVSPKFKEQMQQRYGDEWDVRLQAFMLKEIGVDAALLTAGAVGQVPEMFAAAGATLKERFMAALTRSAVLSVGGGSVQASLNTLSGQPDNDLTRELTERFLAAFAGEGVNKAISSGFKAIFRGSTEAVAKSAKLPVFKPAIAEGRAAITATAPVIRQVLKATIYGETKVAREVAKLAADALASPNEAKAIRANLVKLTGIPDEELELTLGLGNSIYGEEIFKGVTMRQTYDVARETAKKASSSFDEADTTLNRLTSARERLAKYYEKRPVSTDRARDARKARLATMDEEIAKARTNTDTLRAQADAATSEQKRLEEEFTRFTTGSELADKVIMGDAVGFRIMTEMGSPGVRQQAVNDVFYMGVQDGTFSFRPIEHNPGGMLRPFTRYIGEPNQVLPELSIIKDYQEVDRAIARFSSQFEKMQNAAFQGLNAKQRARVFTVLEQGSDMEKVFSVNELFAKGLGAKEVDAYFAERKLLDIAHLLNDATLTRELSTKGYKQMPDGTVVKPSMKNLTEEQRAQGMVRVSGIRRGSKEPIDDVIKAAELKDLTSVLGYHTGYIPISYKDARWHVSVIDTKTGSVRRLDGFPSFKQAKTFFDNNALKAAQDIATKEGNFDPTEVGRFVPFFGRWSDVAKRAEIGFDRGALNFIDTADEATINRVKNALTNNPDIDIDNLRVVFDKMSLASLKRKHAGARAEGRLSSVDPKPSEESIAEYLQATAFRAGSNDWRAHAIERVTKIWGPEGKGILGPGQAWDTPIDMDKLPTDRKVDASELKQMQAWLKRALTYKTGIERRMEGWGNGILERAYEQGPAGKAFAIFVDALPDLKTINTSVRGLGFMVKLGLFNASQVLVQTSQAAFTAGANVRDLVPAMKDFVNASVAIAAQKTGARMTREQRQLVDALTRSGYVADLSTTDMVTILGGGLPTMQRMIDYYGGMAGTKEYLKSGIKNLGGKVNTAGNSFVMAGEAMNRTFAFMANRQRAIRLMKSGEFLGLDGKPFKGAIDDPEFLRLVTDRAMITALNMAKSGQIEALSGLGATAFQFKQVLPKSIALYTSPKLSASAKLGAAAVGIALLGPQAIPGLIDLWHLAGWVNYKLKGTPSARTELDEWARRSTEKIADFVMDIDDGSLAQMGVDREFVKRALSKGLIYAASKGEIDIVNRLALGRFVEETFDYSDPSDLIVIWSVFADTIKATGNIAEFVNNYYEAAKRDPINPDVTGLNLTGDILRETGKVISSVGYASRFLENAFKEEFDSAYHKREAGTPDTITSSSGQNTGVEVTKGRLFQYLVGLTPGKVTGRLDVIEAERMYRDAIADFTKRQLEEYIRYDGDSSAQARIFFETQKELMSVNSLLGNIGLEGARPKGGATNWIAQEMKRFVQFEVRKHNDNSKSSRKE